MTGFTIIHSGILSSIQDAGRVEWQHLGVSRSGPMDWHAAAWANRLVNNPATTPLIEITLGGLQLQSNVDTWIAITGAMVDIDVDGQKKSVWSRFRIQKGQRLKLGFARYGQRIYLAVPNGFSAKPILNSVATQTREHLGGLNADGETLQKGQYLTCCNAAELFSTSAIVPDEYRTKLDDEHVELNVLLGGDEALFSQQQKKQFFSQSWQISNQSNRMGIRLQGNALQSPKRQWSLGVIAGTIQVPPDGQPIILAADCQSMGGYPILGWVCPLDLYRLSQCQAKQYVTFKPEKLPSMQKRMMAFQQFFGLSHC